MFVIHLTLYPEHFLISIKCSFKQIFNICKIIHQVDILQGFPGSSAVKNLPAVQDIPSCINAFHIHRLFCKALIIFMGNKLQAWNYQINGMNYFNFLLKRILPNSFLEIFNNYAMDLKVFLFHCTLVALRILCFTFALFTSKR